MDNLRDYFSALRQGEVLERKRKRYVLSPEFNLEEAYREERISEIGLDQETITTETLTLHRLGCSHVTGAIGAQELVGFCEKCNCAVCFRCGVRCSRCLKLVCPGCLKIYESSPYCTFCRNLRFCKRGLVAGVKGLHSFLSKEF